jgi:hypothetical protein
MPDEEIIEYNIHDVFVLPSLGIPNDIYMKLSNEGGIETAECYRAKNNGVLIPMTSTEAILAKKATNLPLIGVIDNSNAIFTTPHNFVPSTLEVKIGITLKIEEDYQVTGVNQIQFTSSVLVGETPTASYTKA